MAKFIERLTEVASSAYRTNDPITQIGVRQLHSLIRRLDAMELATEDERYAELKSSFEDAKQQMIQAAQSLDDNDLGYCLNHLQHNRRQLHQAMRLRKRLGLSI